MSTKNLASYGSATPKDPLTPSEPSTTTRSALKKARYCSASGMFADAGVPEFYALIRNRIASFWETVENSNN
ncbi:jg8036 [Pararge aegeria aegeria]|uniref:Jg8036 protein n=1 Tax=Pararge aegeria aegeria TaxID=348720 RepID=A0A8S4RGW7_9NEOP|nr:jg8036 [Pararge aegeria aegeria]